jgi:hypothetical protein
MKIIDYIKNVRLFEMLYDAMDFYNIDTKNALLQYANIYIEYKNWDLKIVEDKYTCFIKQYTKDTKYYLRYNSYPAITSKKSYNISREEYDIFLLLSTILTPHRYQIMCEIFDALESKPNALVIGSGIGIEIELIKDNYQSIDAYDLTIDNFSANTHKSVNFFEKEFKGQSPVKYNDIYIIELLEHVTNPYSLLQSACNSLCEDGRIIITLAVNVPQFDHVYNFNDTTEFQHSIKQLGLSIVYSCDIPHQYLINGLKDSSNIFIILQKSNQSNNKTKS